MAPCAATFATRRFWRSLLVGAGAVAGFFGARAAVGRAVRDSRTQRTPEYAVVDAAVQTAKATDAVRAAGLINAVLRRYLRERKTLDAEIARKPATRHASPVWLADRFRADWPVRWTQLLAASDSQAPMWLRVNPRHATAAGLPGDAAEGGDRRRARRSAFCRPWCWTRPAMCMTCRDSRRASSPCRTWARSALHFLSRWPPVSAFSTPAPRRAARPR